jgi:hypothetical protein
MFKFKRGDILIKKGTNEFYKVVTCVSATHWVNGEGIIYKECLLAPYKNVKCIGEGKTLFLTTYSPFLRDKDGRSYCDNKLSENCIYYWGSYLDFVPYDKYVSELILKEDKDV